MPKNSDSVWQRYRHLVRRRPAADVRDELQFHLDMRAEEARKAGLSPLEAEIAALERFGAYDDVEAEVVRIDDARDRRRTRSEWRLGWRQDLRFGLRSLRRAPSFALTAIATLAIAIGANTAIYSVVHAILLTPLPYLEPQRLVTLWGSSFGELLALRQKLQTVGEIAAFAGVDANFDDGSSAERLGGAAVTVNLFATLGARPMIGRTFSPDENDRGSTDVIVLSEGLWRRRLGGDAKALGRRILIDGVPVTIIGVMPNTFRFPEPRTTFWRPLVIDRANNAGLWTSTGQQFIGRLRAAATVDAARREIRRVAIGLRHENPVWDPGATYGSDADVEPLRDALVGGARPLLLLLSSCAGLVLLIACVNVANLLLARVSAREREFAIRAAIGGGRGRLLRQLLTESVVLSSVSAALGLALAGAGVYWLRAALPPDVPRSSEIAMNGAVLGFTAVVALLTGILFGVLPALRATRESSGSDVARSGRTGYGPRHHRVSAVLVVGEVALAVSVVIGAQLLVRSFRDLRRLDPGFQTAQIVTARVSPSRTEYGAPARADAFYATLLPRLGALPGVQGVAAVSRLPLAEAVRGVAVRVEGQYENGKETLPWVNHLEVITPGFLRTMGIALRRGREFTDDDREGVLPVGLVSESMARRFWPRGDPVGKRVGYPYESPWITVVGVVADVRSDSLRDTTALSLYVPFLQRPRDVKGRAQAGFTIVARTSADPLTLGREVQSIVASLDRAVPVSYIQTMDEVVSGSVSTARFAMLLVGGFAVVALLLGAVGIYGVISYVVSQRMRELGVRAALGATSGDILRMVIGRAAILAAAGAVLGMLAAAVAIYPVRALLYGISAADPISYLTVSLGFVAVAVIASAMPALRAARVSPTSVLRAD